MPNRWGTVHDNEIFVDFDIMIDIDMAIYKLIRKKYKNNDYVDKKIISLKSEYDAIYLMINRKELNPLSVLMPNFDTSKLYKSLFTNKNDLLSFAKPTDIFYLMNTFKNNASSVNITVHCNDEIEYNYFNDISKMIGSKYKVICSSKEETSLKEYTVIYIKNFVDLVKFKDLDAKNVYIANTLYNTFDMLKNIEMLKTISNSNEIRTIDMYKKVKAESIPDSILEEIDKK